MAIGDFRKYHIENLKDNKEAMLYIEIAMEEFKEDGDKEAFLLALQDVAEAKGIKLPHIKDAVKMPNIVSILKELGLKIKLEPLNNHNHTEHRP